MLKYLAISLLAAAALAQQPAAQQTSAPKTTAQEPAFKAKKLSRAELDAYLANPDRILLIDVRRPDEIASIGGFPVYLSIQIKDLKDHLKSIPTDRTIITISNHAARAGVAADLLTANGFKVAGAVGAQLYEAEGGTLLKVAPPKPAAKSETTVAPAQEKGN
jgi:rhodanese-related sulfurtransferase